MEIKEKIITGLTTLSVVGSGIAAALAVHTHKLVGEITSLFDRFKGWPRAEWSRSLKCIEIIEGSDNYDCRNRFQWSKQLEGYKFERTIHIVAAAFLLLTAVAGACYLYRCYKHHQNQQLPFYQQH